MTGFGGLVAEPQHGAALVVDDGGAVVDPDRADAEKGESPGWPVVAAGGLAQAADLDCGVQRLAESNGFAQDYAPVEEVGDDALGGDGALPDRDVHDERRVGQASRHPRHGLRQGRAQGRGEGVAADGLVDGGLALVDRDGGSRFEHLPHREVVEVGARVDGRIGRAHRGEHGTPPCPIVATVRDRVVTTGESSWRGM